MKYKVLSKLQTGEGTFVAGDEIELSENLEETKELVESGVLGVVETAVASEKVNYSKMKVNELKTLAEGRGIDIEGLNKAELVEALEEGEEEESEEGEENEEDNNKETE